MTVALLLKTEKKKKCPEISTFLTEKGLVSPNLLSAFYIELLLESHVISSQTGKGNEQMLLL